VFVSRCVSPSLRAQGGHRKVMGKGSSLMTFGSYPKCKTAPRRPQRQAPPVDPRGEGSRGGRKGDGHCRPRLWEVPSVALTVPSLVPADLISLVCRAG
jgi:hypothetical protein